MSNNIAKTGETNCKIVSYSTILKTRGNDKMYQEAIEASSKFNKRLANERKMRIPFIDSQTTVAQANCMIWHLEYERSKADRDGYVFSYPVKNWYKTRRLAFENDSSNMLHRLQLPSEFTHQQIINENSNHSSIDNHHHHHHHHHHHNHNHNHHHQTHVLSKQTSNSNDDYNTRLDEWHDDFNDPVNDNDPDSDGDDYEDSKRGKKKRGGAGGRSKKGLAKEAIVNGDDKPFVCDKCGVKYKTKPGLSYHVQKAHSGINNTANTPVHHSTGSKSHDLIENENTNSVFDSVYDDTSSSLPQTSSNNNNNSTTNFSTSIANIHSSNGNSSNKSNLNKCGVCLGTEQESRSGQHEPFVSCCECTKSFHPLCLNFTTNMIKSVKKYKWQCIECKRCTICGNSENDDKLLFCDDCDRGYHMYCLNPPLTTAPEGDWRCDLCIKQFGTQQN